MTTVDCRFKIANSKLQIAESVSKQLGAWIQSLLNSDMKGQPYMSDKVRRANEAAHGREEFLRELERIRKGQAGPPGAL